MYGPTCFESHSFLQHLLSMYYMPFSLLNAGHTIIINASIILALNELIAWRVGKYKQIHIGIIST